MRNRQNAVAVQLAPRTQVSGPQFEEPDWPVEFRAIRGVYGHLLLLIDLYERAGAEQGVHCIILQADEPIALFANIEMAQKPDRDFPPDFDHAGKQTGLLHFETRIEPHRKGDGAVVMVG